MEIRLGAATAASSEPGPPGRARGSAARGGRAEGPGRAGARAPDRARGAGPAARPIPSQPDELSRQFQHVRVMDRVEGPGQVPRPGGLAARVLAPRPPRPPRPPDAPGSWPRRALQTASARPGLSAQRSPGEGRRVPPPGPGAQTGESTRRARSPLPASLAAAACAPRSPSTGPRLGALGEYLPFVAFGGVSAGPGRGSDTQASPGSPRASCTSSGPRSPPGPSGTGSSWLPLPGAKAPARGDTHPSFT